VIPQKSTHCRFAQRSRAKESVIGRPERVTKRGVWSLGWRGKLNAAKPAILEKLKSHSRIVKTNKTAEKQSVHEVARTALSPFGGL
jgi:hypothetical protein